MKNESILQEFDKLTAQYKKEVFKLANKACREFKKNFRKLTDVSLKAKFGNGTYFITINDVPHDEKDFQNAYWYVEIDKLIDILEEITNSYQITAPKDFEIKGKK